MTQNSLWSSIVDLELNDTAPESIENLSLPWNIPNRWFETPYLAT